MRERFLDLFRRKTDSKNSSNQAGYPVELAENLQERADEENTSKMVITRIDDEGNPEVKVINLANKKVTRIN